MKTVSELDEAGRKFHFTQQENEGVCINSVENHFQVDGCNGSDNVLVEVCKEGISNFAKLLRVEWNLRKPNRSGLIRIMTYLSRS